MQSVAKGDLDLGSLEDEAEKEAQKKIEDEFKSITERIKTALGESVEEVRDASFNGFSRVSGSR